MTTTSARSVLLSRNAELAEHVSVFKRDRDQYEATARDLVDKKTAFASSAKVRAAALCWRVGKRDTTEKLLEAMNVSEVLSLVKLLDVDRQLRALDRKAAKCSTKRRKGTLKAARDRLEREAIPMPGVSATKSLMKRVKRWTKRIPADTLEFFLLNFPVDPWRDLADLVHLSPKDFTLPYFLDVIFGGKPPTDSLTHVLRTCNTQAELQSAIRENPKLKSCYSVLRTKYKKHLTPGVRAELAKGMPLVELIWWYEEVEFPGLDKLISERMANGESVHDETGKGRDEFGKLMERLLLLRKRKASFVAQLCEFADAQLEAIRIPTTKTVAVLGDASSSMQVAVESAAIIGSVVCSCLSGTLRFFSGKDFKPRLQPRSVADILAVTDEVRASGSTAPAASLLPYLREKKPVDLFIVVTDEEENTSASGAWLGGNRNCQSGSSGGKSFAALFKEYIEQVYSQAQVVFVSFLADTRVKGQMMADMEAIGLAEKCTQFRFSPTRPDLSKLHQLLGLLALEAEQARDEPETQPGAEEGVFVTDADGDVPLFCADGTVTVTTTQAEAVKNAFVDLDTISIATLRAALPKLRISAKKRGETDEEDRDVDCDAVSVMTGNTGWSIVDNVAPPSHGL